MFARSGRVVRATVFPRWQPCYPSAGVVWSAPPPSKVRQFTFECCPLLQEISSAIHYLPCLEVTYHCVCLLRVQHWEISSLPHPLFRGKFNMPPIPSPVHVRLQFIVCFSVLLGSLGRDADIWVRRSSLWSTTCPASGSGFLPPCSQPSLPFLSLFTESLVLSLAPFPSFFYGQVQCATHPSTLYARVQFTVMFFSFVGGGSASPGAVG
jgi:hypothetical protein